MSVNNSHTAMRTTFRDSTTPRADTAVTVATTANRATGRGIVVGRLRGGKGGGGEVLGRRPPRGGKREGRDHGRGARAPTDFCGAARRQPAGGAGATGGL